MGALMEHRWVLPNYIHLQVWTKLIPQRRRSVQRFRIHDWGSVGSKNRSLGGSRACTNGRELTYCFKVLMPSHFVVQLAFKSPKRSWEWYEEPGNESRLKRFAAAMEGSSKADPPDAILQGSSTPSLSTIRYWTFWIGSKASSGPIYLVILWSLTWEVGSATGAWKCSNRIPAWNLLSRTDRLSLNKLRRYVRCWGLVPLMTQ